MASHRANVDAIGYLDARAEAQGNKPFCSRMPIDGAMVREEGGRLGVKT